MNRLNRRLCLRMKMKIAKRKLNAEIIHVFCPLMAISYCFSREARHTQTHTLHDYSRSESLTFWLFESCSIMGVAMVLKNRFYTYSYHYCKLLPPSYCSVRTGRRLCYHTGLEITKGVCATSFTFCPYWGTF